MLIVDERYYGCKTDYDSTNFLEWMHAIKLDFKKFIKYYLDGRNSKLEEKLEYVSDRIGEEYNFGLQENSYSRIRMSDKYLVFSYPIYDNEYDEYYFNVVIISRDYKTFYFIDTHDNITHKVESFIVNKDNVQKYEFHMKEIFHYFIDESLNNFLEYAKNYTLNK